MPDQPAATPAVVTTIVADQAFLRAAATMDSKRTGAYNTAEAYYDGDHETKLTDRLKEYLEVSGLRYTENFCETVVDALAERLSIAGFESDKDGLADWLQERFWDANELDAGQVRVHLEATKLGDSYLIADWDPERQIVTFTYNSPHNVKVEYRNGEARYAVKVWDTDARSSTNPSGQALKRMNVYYPDRIEKWFRLSSDEAGDWVPHRDEGDAAWPMPWLTKSDPPKPRGIPVFHFANKPRRDHYGRAEHRGTIPQQDRLNKELLDLSAILDTMGWPQRTVAGATVAELKTAPGEIWTGPKDAKFEQFEAADPAGPLESIGKTIERMAGRSRTPTHMLMAEQEAPSGESRKTAESGLVAKAKNRHVFHGQTWINAARMALVIAADEATGDEAKPPIEAAAAAIVKINVNWTDPETRNEKEHLESLALMLELGVSHETVLGMIPGIDAASELEKRAKEDADAADRMMAAFDRGGAANPADPGQAGPQPPRPGRPPVPRPPTPPAPR